MSINITNEVLNIAKKDPGKEFEQRIQENSKDVGIYTYRVKDVSLPPDVRMRVKLTKNRYDFLFFYNGKLIPSELKSTKAKSFSFEGTNPKIKQHQIDALTEDSEYEDVFPILLLNYREPTNRCFIVRIQDFNFYRLAAKGEVVHDFTGRINEKSFPLHIAEQIGIEVKNVKKRTRYTYLIKPALDKLIEKYA